MEITGKTLLFGILADPITQVKTPQQINKLFAQINFDGILVPMHVHAENLEDIIKSLRKLENLGGVIVTVPHKTEVIKYCDYVSDDAKKVGAANIIRRNNDGTLSATILDGEGFISGLIEAGYQLRDKKVYLVGAGGAANAIAFSLLQQGLHSLTLFNRTISKAVDLKNRLLTFYPEAEVNIGTSDVSYYDVVINATILGLRSEDPLPIEPSTLRPNQLVCDIIMHPKETPLLQTAKQKGSKVHYGLPMLDKQLELMLKFWTTTT